jgi:hypothetical protein
VLAPDPPPHAAVLGQLEHAGSRRVARELGRMLDAPWWGRLELGDAIRAARVVAHLAACADGARPEPVEPCRRTILDNTLASLLPPRGRFALCFADLPVDDETVIAGLRLGAATAVLNRRMIAAADAPLGEGPGGWLEARVGTATVVHEVNHLHNPVPHGPTHAAFQDEYRAWYVAFVAEAGRPPRRVDALDRCRELLAGPGYAAFAHALASGSAQGERILGFLRELGPVQRWQDVLALPRDGFLEPAPLPRPRLNMTNAPDAARAPAADAAAADPPGSA